MKRHLSTLTTVLFHHFKPPNTTFQRNYSVNLGLCPGMVMFLNNYSAIEVNVGVLGFGYTHTKSTTDQIYVANLKTRSANFKVNLFSISFGAVFYL